MKGPRGAVIELVLALVAAIGCVLSWLAAVTTVEVPPIIEGEPLTTSSVYSPPLLTLSLLLATVAGVLAVLGVARLRRARRGRVDSAAQAPANGRV
ncbi:MAG: hypothetical protein ACXWD8_19390 [Mycobacterium sp.]